MTEDTSFKERKNKLDRLREMGVNPYPYSYEVTHKSVQLLEKYAHLEDGAATQDEVSIAGRVMTKRVMGKLAFIHLQDDAGQIQLFISQADIGEELFKHIDADVDLGDIVGIKGVVVKTKKGEISVRISAFTFLTKALRPLPDKFHGLKDPEIRYRQRYLDLIANTDVREVFRKRSAIVSAIREFMAERGFMEVETPLLQTQYGGASARPFKTHINAWNMSMYLSISPELYLKRLIVGGFDRVYTICKNFRNEGVDHSHNPEFTMLEAYQAYADYNDMMELIEQCYEFVALRVNGTTKTTVRVRNGDGSFQDIDVDFKAPWPRKTLAELVQEHVGIDVLHMSVEELRSFCTEKKLEINTNATWGDCALIIFDELVENKIVAPTHVIDRPRESTPLCKAHREDPRLIEQNEPIAAGMELGNMYSELNDPILQRELLVAQAEQLRGGNDEAHPMDEDFVNAIEQGLPPTGGIGWGIDRMVMLLLGQTTVRDVILFPTMRPKVDDKET